MSVCFFQQVRKKRKVRNIIYKVDPEKCSECEGEEDRTEDIKENVAQRELTIYTSAAGKNTKKHEPEILQFFKQDASLVFRGMTQIQFGERYNWHLKIKCHNTGMWRRGA